MKAPRSRAAATGALLVLSAALAACPLPQPLPGVTPLDGGTITPPRIQMDNIAPSATVVFYDPAACAPDAGAPGFTLGGSVVDQNVDEVVTVRWFVDYDPSAQPSWTIQSSESLAAPIDPTQTVRPLTPWTFIPGQWPPLASWTPPPGYPSSSPFVVWSPHVVEVVVSNGFAGAPPDGGQASPPNRAAAPGYETQFFRWVFEPMAGAGCGP